MLFMLPMVSLFCKKIAAWMVHLFTASGAFFGLIALYAIHQNQIRLSLLMMLLTIFIDSVDGFFARIIGVKKIIPRLDGALLDNIVDFFNYVIVPCFFLLVTQLISPDFMWWCMASIVLSSCYQFTQIDAKTTDYFFKGFPSYWNLVVLYLYLAGFSPITNAVILLVLSVLSFIPIKYIYPSRLTYFSKYALLRYAMTLLTWVWGVVTLLLLYLHPESNLFLIIYSICYIAIYFLISLYRTFVPLSEQSVF